MEVTEDGLCWCGSGKPYEACHKAIDDEIKLHQLAGEEVPTRDMIKSAAQIEGIRKACALNTAVLDEVAKYIRKGMTTEEIDQIVYQFTTKHGGIPAPLHFCGFPKSVCTSVNDQVCHGIPDKQVVLRSGDIVNVDVSTIVDGYYADASRMFEIGHVDKRAKDLVAITKECLNRGVAAAQPGPIWATWGRPASSWPTSTITPSSRNSAATVSAWNSTKIPSWPMSAKRARACSWCPA